MQPKALWNRYMACYDFLNRVDGYVESLKSIAERVPCQSRVLDAGSGTGNLTMLLKEKGSQVLALDFSESAIREHLAKDPEASVLQASLEDPLPLEDNHFDYVCCASVLFALTGEGRRCAMKEFWRVLKPGGELLVTVAAPCQRNGNLVSMHWRGQVRQRGYVAGATRFLLDLPHLLRVVYFNRLLRRLPENRGYHRMTPDELVQLASSSSLTAKELTYTYSGRFMLLRAVKAR